MIIVLDIFLLIILLVMGVPVALSFVAASLFLIVMGDYSDTVFLITAGFSKISSTVLLAIPLYILAGAIMAEGGIAKRLLDLSDAIIGRFRGGTGIVVVITTAAIGAISGMASSAVATIGSIAIPRMVKQGYDRGYATALVSCSSVLALLITPSSTMILYEWITNTSIPAVFLAPVILGFILISLFIIWNAALTRKMPLKIQKNKNSKSMFHLTKKAGFGLAMPVIILGLIYGGITTPTEAAAIAVIYALPIAIYGYKEIRWSRFYGNQHKWQRFLCY